MKTLSDVKITSLFQFIILGECATVERLNVWMKFVCEFMKDEADRIQSSDFELLRQEVKFHVYNV